MFIYTQYLFIYAWLGSFSLCNLLFEYVHRGLVGFELLVLEEDPPSQLQWRRQMRVIAEVAFKEEARHKAFPEHSLVRHSNVTDRCQRMMRRTVKLQKVQRPQWNPPLEKMKVPLSPQSNIQINSGDVRCPEANS